MTAEHGRDPYEVRIKEGKNEQGSISRLSSAVSDILKTYAGEYAEVRGGWVTMSTFDSVSVTMRQRAQKETIIGGLTRGIPLFNSRPAPYIQQLRLQKEDGRTDLEIKAAANGSFTAKARSFVEDAFSPELRSLDEAEIRSLLGKAQHVLDDGFPLAAEVAIGKRQKQECREIEGEEATAYQGVMEKMIKSQGNVGFGNIKQHLLFRPRSAIVDGQWSVSGVSIHQGVGPSTPEVQGRAVVSNIQFSPDTIRTLNGEPLDGRFLVTVEGVYQDITDRLLWTNVRFMNDGQLVPFSPYDRSELFSAIEHQVTPETMSVDKR